MHHNASEYTGDKVLDSPTRCQAINSSWKWNEFKAHRKHFEPIYCCQSFFSWSIWWKYHNDYSLNYIPKDLQQHYKCQQECLGMYKTPKISQYFASFISCKQQSQHGLSVKIKRITKKAVAHFNSMKINYTVMWTNIQSLCHHSTANYWEVMSHNESVRSAEADWVLSP